MPVYLLAVAPLLTDSPWGVAPVGMSRRMHITPLWSIGTVVGDRPRLRQLRKSEETSRGGGYQTVPAAFFMPVDDRLIGVEDVQQSSGSTETD